MLKKFSCVIYILTLVVLGIATGIEHAEGNAFVARHVYGAWWFSLLWALLAATGVAYIIRKRVRRWSILLLHLSLVVILVGAGITRFTSYKGVVHLRGDAPTREYRDVVSMGEPQKHPLPFLLKLDKFDVHYHAGTSSAADYSTRFVIIDGNRTIHAAVSMNKVFHYRGIRFFQSNYDDDHRGSYLSLNSDPWGVPVTYTGYALLFFSLLWLLVDPTGVFRSLLRHPVLQKGAGVLGLLFCLSQGVRAQAVLPKETAGKMGQLFMLYNDRICPMQTFALDFTKKLHGSRSYKGMTAEQVVSGWIFHNDDWADEPFIRVKSGAVREALKLDEYCSLNRFFGGPGGGYVLGPYVQEYYEGNDDKLHRQIVDIDRKIALIMDLRRGSQLKLFPYTTPARKQGEGGATVWYSPTDTLPATMEHRHAEYIGNVFSLIFADVKAGNLQRVDEFFVRMKYYQKTNAGTTLPTPLRFKAERLYNAIPLATILFMVNLAMGIVTLLLTIRGLTSGRPLVRGVRDGVVVAGAVLLSALSFAALTLALSLRWIVSGTIPLSNGYESMLSVAWFVQLFTIVLSLRVRHLTLLISCFGFLLSGFFLLVSHIGQMDPAIGQLMPVLDSPLLSVHVSVVMMSYALLALTFICAVMGLCLPSQGEKLQVLSRVFLYPAIVTLGLGIFIGAIWANVSWGAYWSWDPKETWALITFMVYAVVLHTQSLPVFSRPRAYHLYMSLAFLSILMTFFGVNYVLGGMHSYA